MVVLVWYSKFANVTKQLLQKLLKRGRFFLLLCCVAKYLQTTKQLNKFHVIYFHWGKFNTRKLSTLQLKKIVEFTSKWYSIMQVLTGLKICIVFKQNG